MESLPSSDQTELAAAESAIHAPAMQSSGVPTESTAGAVATSTETASPDRPFLPQSLLIAAFPILSYAVVFAYQFGFCNRFGIPPALITLNITSAFTVVAVIFFTAMNVYAQHIPTLASLYNLSDDEFRHIQDALYLSAFFTAAACGLIAWWLLVVANLFLWSRLFAKISKYRSDETFRAKLIAKREANTFGAYVRRRLGRRWFLAVVFAFYGFAALYSLGYSATGFSGPYLVTKTSAPEVLLGIYGDYFVTAPLDVTPPSATDASYEQKIKQELVIRKVGEAGHIVFVRRNLGVLRFSRDKAWRYATLWEKVKPFLINEQ